MEEEEEEFSLALSYAKWLRNVFSDDVTKYFLSWFFFFTFVASPILHILFIYTLVKTHKEEKKVSPL